MKEMFIKLGLAGIAALAPIHAVMITVGVLIFADLITGIWAARKKNEEFSSARLRDSISKIAIYQLVIITGYLVETHLIHNLVPVTKLVAGVIGMVEITSLIENANKILGQNMFGILLDKLGSKNAMRVKKTTKVKRKKK